jgi:aminopeptidase N
LAALLGGLLARPASRDATWAFVQAQWSTLTQKLGTFQGLPSIVGSLGGFCSVARAAEVRRFFTQNVVRSAERSLRQALERIENCAALRDRQAPALASWLQSFR